jgi:dUTP pyrophosphatase
MSQPELKVQVRRLPGNEDIPLPGYQSEGAVAMDVHAAVPAAVTLGRGEWGVIPCGFALAIPHGFEGQLRPRSGLAAKHAVTVLNSPGTIDPDYRGEVKVVLINHGRDPFVVERGARVAQILILPVPRVAWVETDALPATARGEGGFGHTG